MFYGYLSSVLFNFIFQKNHRESRNKCPIKGPKGPKNPHILRNGIKQSEHFYGKKYILDKTNSFPGTLRIKKNVLIQFHRFRRFVKMEFVESFVRININTNFSCRSK